jgi:hypothetical protein
LAEHRGGFGFGPEEARSALLRGFAFGGARGAAGGFVLPLGQLNFCGNFRGYGLGPVLQAPLRDTSHARTHTGRAPVRCNQMSHQAKTGPRERERDS